MQQESRMPSIFDPLSLRGTLLRNRLGVAPMCQYMADDGIVGDWHMVHLGSRAIGGNGVVMAEATGVVPEGRISDRCPGLWNDEQAEAFAPIAAFIAEHGGVPAIQLAHAGRKASRSAPWLGGGHLDDGAWTPVAPSAIAFSDDYTVPHPLAVDEIADIVAAFSAAALRAVGAGFTLLEVHAAHGYLLHSFLSPLANQRDDGYGGSIEGRSRMLLEVVRAVRSTIPDHIALAVRLSATDWLDGGWGPDDSVWVSGQLAQEGVDLIDCSSGGIAPGASIPLAPGYQVPFAARIKAEVDVATAAVGMITEPAQAADIVASNQADVVLMARESLRDPYFPRRAAQALGKLDAITPPSPYLRGWT